MRIAIIILTAALAACSDKPAPAIEDNAVVAVPKLDSFEFTAGAWAVQAAPDGGEAAAYVDVERIPLFIVQCDRAARRVAFKLAGDLPDGVHMMHVETDGASDDLPAAAETGDVAMVVATAPADSRFVATLAATPKRIGARLASAPGFLAPGDDAVVKVVRGCR